MKYEMLKLKTLENHSSKVLLATKVDETNLFLRKALVVIFKYHLKNKKILLAGMNSEIHNKYVDKLKKTRHVFIPEYKTDESFFTRSIEKNIVMNAKKAPLLKNSISLIVILNPKVQPLLVRKAVNLKIPLIIFTIESGTIGHNCYKIPLEPIYFEKTRKNFFSLFFNTITKIDWNEK
jgi:hypothetical protein